MLEFLKFAALFVVPGIVMVSILILLDLLVLRWQRLKGNPSY
jgi:hypothetical protein